MCPMSNLEQEFHRVALLMRGNLQKSCKASGFCVSPCQNEVGVQEILLCKGFSLNAIA